MDDARLFELLVDLHRDLPRLGPGDAATTRRALACCGALPSSPGVLDVGCGTGAQTLDLADATGGSVVAVDLFPAFLVHLRSRARASRLTRRVRPLAADMRALPLREESFDLIWSEGAVYLMGFDAGLSGWRRLLRRGGYLVVSELSWFRPEPPAWLRDYWRHNYPGMRTIEANLAAAAGLGFEEVARFRLPVDAWIAYHRPLRGRLPEFRRRHGDDPEAAAVAAATAEEIDVMARSMDDCGYAFYVLRRPGR